MEKQTKVSYLLLGFFILFGFIHNFVYALFSLEEPVFFSLSLLSFFAFLGSIIYSLITYFRKGRPKDIWKLGWLGLLGLLGFSSRFGTRFYGLYGFFGFFGLKKK